MAISPITIATHGLLNSPLSVAAVRGRLRIETAVPPTGPGGGGVSPVPGQWVHPYELKERLWDQIMREEEEIIAIIIAAAKVIG